MYSRRAWALSMLLLAGVTEAGEPVDEALDVAAQGEVSIDVRRGSVTVIGWDEPRVAVVGTRDDRSTALVFERDGDFIRIEDQVPDDARGGDGTRITVRMPRNHEIRTNLVSADLDVEGVRGRSRLRTVSGDIGARELGDDTTLHTVSGDIELAGAGRELVVDTVSGDVEVDVTAVELDVESVSGDIDVRNRGELDRGKVSTVSGDLDVATPFGADADVSLQTVSGDITLTVEGEPSLRVMVDAGIGGDIVNGLAATDGVPVKRGPSERLDLKLGTGKGNVEMSTLSGTVKLKN